MSDKNNSALGLGINSAFSACPHCGARKYRRLDDDGGADQDRRFFLSLSLWGLLPLVPFFLIGAWSPDEATLMRFSVDHPMLFGVLRAYLLLFPWSAVQVWMWICFAILCAASYGVPRFFAACTACCTGSFSDPAKYPRFSEKQFPPKSIPSRFVVAILRIANLRLIPWLGVC